MREIGEKHGLHIDKIGELASETGLVFLGLTRPQEFVSNLAERLGVAREAARDIAADVNERVFLPVREHLKALHHADERAFDTSADTARKTPPPAPTLPVQKWVAQNTQRPQPSPMPPLPGKNMPQSAAAEQQPGSRVSQFSAPSHAPVPETPRTPPPAPQPPPLAQAPAGVPTTERLSFFQAPEKPVRSSAQSSLRTLPTTPEEQAAMRRKAFEELVSLKKPDEEESVGKGAPAPSLPTRETGPRYSGPDPYREPANEAGENKK